MMVTRVIRAFLSRGSPNAVTPLLTASTPVMAVQPLEKARTQHPQPRRFRGVSEWWRRDHRHRMSTGRNRLPYAQSDCYHQTAYEQIRRKQEDHARVAHAAQVDQGDDDQCGHRKRQRVGLQSEDRRDRGSYSGRDAYRHHEYVIDH